ncbi:hypothetical protein IHE44_0006704 [Lamprotornis superbus]|uniref:Uncharacterized protein n=1 Tax=Lamprotornis superbus TaxID=245042 RepID=A0A835NFH3_9PASS|nr:hypothetical protein IHE44_0006704 [Lamprotornis superbus]
MQHTTCTEDRIYHALERCLHGLSRDAVSSRWAGSRAVPELLEPAGAGEPGRW